MPRSSSCFSHPGHCIFSPTVSATIGFIGILVGCLILRLANTDVLSAESNQVISFESLFSPAEKHAPKISPNGQRVAFLSQYKGVQTLWMRVWTNDVASDHVVLPDIQAPVLDFLWQGDGEHVLFIRDSDGRQNWHIYQIHLATGILRDMTPFLGARAHLVASDARFPDQILVGINLRAPALFDVYRLNLRHGGILLDTENPGDVSNWAVDSSFQVRGALAVLEDGSTEIRARNDPQSLWRRVLRWPVTDGPGVLHGFTHNGKSLYVTSAVESESNRLLEIDVSTGQRKIISEHPVYDVNGVMLNPLDKQPEAVLHSRAREEWFALGTNLVHDLDYLGKALKGDFNVVSRDIQDKHWIVASEGGAQPLTFHRYDRVKHQIRPLFAAHPGLVSVNLANVDPIQLNARDGLPLHGYLVAPPHSELKALPTVLLVHSGPWARDNFAFNRDAQWLASRGYLVLMINFRGSTGFGKAHLKAGDKEWGRKMVEDLIDAKNWAVKQGYADPRRMGIFGSNYGGHAVLAAMTFFPLEFTCGVDLFGPTDLIKLVGSIPMQRKLTREMFEKRVGNPLTEVEMLKERSPLFHARRVARPVLIVQGKSDAQSPKADAESLVSEIRSAGIQADYLEFPDEAYGFSKMENASRFYLTLERFLSKHLGGRLSTAPSKN